MHKYFLLIIPMILISVSAYSQQDVWGNEESIKSLAPDQIINEPEKARPNWQTFTSEQRESVYRDPNGIKEFSDLFATEKGIKGLDLSAGSPYYDGVNLQNGDSYYPVSSLKNAHATSLAGGGFKIKFPDKTDLRGVGFDGGEFGISFEGTDLQFREGSLSSGSVKFDDYGYEIGAYSDFTADALEFSTEQQSLDFYHSREHPSKNHFVESYNPAELRIVGDDITVKFTDGNGVEVLRVDGKVTVKNGEVTLEFDGKGKAEESLSLEEPETSLAIEDENAPDKLYVLSSGDESDNADITLTGFGACSLPMTGSAILDVTGRASQGICKGPLVQTGGVIADKMYEASLFLNENEAEKARQTFISRFGREPNIDNEKDLKELSNIINGQVTEVKLTQRFLADQKFSQRQVWNVMSYFLSNAGIPVSSLTFSEISEIWSISSLVKSIKKDDVVEFQASGDKGLIIYHPEEGAPKEIEVSGRLVRTYIKNFYDENLKPGEGQSKHLLSFYFGKKIAATK